MPGALIAAELSTIAAIGRLGQVTAARLVARHGTEAPAVVALGARRDLLRPLAPGRPFLEAEVVWAVRHELALSLDDVLARRMRLAQGCAITVRGSRPVSRGSWPRAGLGRRAPGTRGRLLCRGCPPRVRGHPARARGPPDRHRFSRAVIVPSPGATILGPVEALDDLQRSFFDALYTYRIPILVGSIVAVIVVLVIAWQRGWFGALVDIPPGPSRSASSSWRSGCRWPTTQPRRCSSGPN